MCSLRSHYLSGSWLSDRAARMAPARRVRVLVQLAPPSPHVATSTR